MTTHYSVMILYHSIKNSKEESMSKNIVKGQRKYNIEETFYKRVNSVSNDTENTRKSSWKKLINQKIKWQIIFTKWVITKTLSSDLLTVYLRLQWGKPWKRSRLKIFVNKLLQFFLFLFLYYLFFKNKCAWLGVLITTSKFFFNSIHSNFREYSELMTLFDARS